MINQLQKRLKEVEVKTRALLKGYVPSASEVEEKVSEHFDVYTPGLPTFKWLKQEHRQTSNSKRYNETFRLLEEDLNVAYLANETNNNALLELEERGQLEETQLLSRLHRLRLHLRQLLKDEARLKVLASENFANFYQVDFIGNTNRNLPPTTTSIHLNSSYIKLPTRPLLSSRSYLGESEIQIHSSSIKESKGSVESLVKDTVNESYHVTTFSSSLSVTVLFKETLTLNTILFEMVSPTSITGNVSLMMEDGSSEILYSLSSYQRFEWNLLKRRVRSLTFNFNKTEADGVDETGTSVYYFLLKRLSVGIQSHDTQATFVSKKIPAKELPLAIQLETEESLFEQTSLEYFIGLDDDAGKIHWRRLTKNQPTSLELTDSVHKVIAKNKIELPEDVIPSTLRVTPFYQRWKLESYTLSQDYLYETLIEESIITDPETEEEVVIQNERLSLQVDLHTLQIDEALKSCTKQEVSYLKLENYHQLLEANTLYIMTQFVELEEVGVLSDLKLSGLSSYRLFVNGTEVHIGKETFNLTLKKGINKVQFVFLTVDTETKAYTYQPYLLKHNVNLKALSSDLYAVEPYVYSEEVSAKEGAFYLKDQVLMINAPEEAPHFIRYEVLKENVKKNLTKTLHGYEANLRFMAVLKSENENFSPILHHYQVISC